MSSAGISPGIRLTAANAARDVIWGRYAAPENALTLCEIEETAASAANLASLTRAVSPASAVTPEQKKRKNK